MAFRLSRQAPIVVGANFTGKVHKSKVQAPIGPEIVSKCKGRCQANIYVDQATVFGSFKFPTHTALGLMHEGCQDVRQEATQG